MKSVHTEKKNYIAPDIELFEIRADERITITSCDIRNDKGTSDIPIKNIHDDYLLAGGVSLS